MSQQPIGWEQATVGELAASLTDGPFGSNLKTEHYTNAGARVVRLQNIADGRFDDSDQAFISIDHFTRLRKHDARPGDLLIAAMGDVLPRVCLVPEGMGPAIVKADCFRLRPSQAVRAKYLAFMLMSPQVRHEAAPMVAGIGRPRLNLSKVAALRIPLPPVAEQERIVAAIEEEFSRLDAGVAALERAGQRLNVLRDEAVLDLVSGSGETRRLGDIADIHLGRQRSPKNHTGPRMRPYLRAANVTWQGLDVSDVKWMNFSPTESSVYELRRGDVLVAEASGSASEVGKPAIWDGAIPDCCFQNTLLRVRSDRFVPQYLYYVLLATARRGTFARASKGVGIHHLSKAGLSALEVHVPPLDVQEELAKKVAAQQDGIADLSSGIDRQHARADVLRATILATAFSGQLVPQDPSDEPASVLIDRIASDRVTSSGHSRVSARFRTKHGPRQKAPA